MGHSIAMAMTDAELLEASKRGEHAAFGTLVERYQDLVSAVSYSRTRDQALSEDVAQETFLVAWRQLDQLREPGRLRAWLCGIARNLASKARRRTVREAPIEDPIAIASEKSNPFDDVCEAQAERVVGEALARVPESYRDVLVLYYREQRSARDVAKSLGISEAAALQRLARGRQYLADSVSALVEKSLTSPRLRRNIAASVVAALPVIGVSRVEAASSSHGGSMFIKLALAAAAITAAGTTAFVVHKSGSDDAPAAVASHVASAPAAAIEPHSTGPRRSITAPPAMPAVKPQPGDAKYTTPPPETVASIDRATSERIGLERGPSRGPANAQITIVMFTDLKCRFCQNVEGSIDQLMDEYPNKVRLVMKQFPVHKAAVLAAEASYAAEAQGKFWEMHEQMLAHNEDLSQDGLVRLAREAGLDVTKFRAALEAHTYADALDADRRTAAELDVQGTPSFVINGRKVIGQLPIAEMRKVLNAALDDK